MKNLNKLLALILAMSIMVTLAATPSMAAIPVLSGLATYDYAVNAEYVYTAPLNSKPFTDGKGLGWLNVSGSGYTATDYVDGLYGKRAGDYALSLNTTGGDIVDYGVSKNWGTRFSSGILHYAYEFAVDSDSVSAGHYFDVTNAHDGTNTAANQYITTSTVGDQATSRVLEFVSGAEENEVVLFGKLKADFDWQKGQWYRIDIIMERGDTATMTLLVDGEPLKLKADQGTLDGVKTTTQKFIVDGNSSLAGVQPLSYINNSPSIGAVRIAPVIGSAFDKMYIDNIEYKLYTAGSDTYSAKAVYTAEAIIDTDFEDGNIPAVIDTTYGASLSIASDADGNKYLKQEMVDEKRFSIPYGSYIADSDRIYFEADARTTSGNTYAIYTQGGRTTYLADHAGTYYADFLDNTYVKNDLLLESEKITQAMITNMQGSWIQSSLALETSYNTNGGDNDGKAPYNIKVNGIPQSIYPFNTIVAADDAVMVKTDADDGDNHLAIDNIKLLAQNYKPYVKSATYYVGDVASTDDYIVSPETDKLVVNLEGKILDNSEDNINKIKLTDLAGNEISITNEYNDKTVTLTLNEDLKANTGYRVVIPAELKLTETEAMGNAAYYDFKTVYAPLDVKKASLLCYDSGAYAEHDGVTVLSDSINIKAKVEFVNTTGQEQTKTLIMAVYNKDNVLGIIDVKEAVVSSDGTTAAIFETENGISFGSAGVDADGAKVYLYILDSISGMQPMKAPYMLWENK